jgi:hypothetical protein
MCRRVPVEEFVVGVIKACKKGMTRNDFAKCIGLNPSSVYQRCYELRKQGVPLPSFPSSAIQRKTPVERAMAAIKAARKAGEI